MTTFIFILANIACALLPGNLLAPVNLGLAIGLTIAAPINALIRN